MIEEYAVVVDHGDAPIVRDALRRAADDRAAKAGNARQASAIKRNTEEARVLRKYAERFEHVRIENAKKVGLKLGLRASQS